MDSRMSFQIFTYLHSAYVLNNIIMNIINKYKSIPRNTHGQNIIPTFYFYFLMREEYDLNLVPIPVIIILSINGS